MSVRPPVIAESSFTNADEFLARLDLREWPARTAFRGHGNASWRLVPSVLRAAEGVPPVWERPRLDVARLFADPPTLEAIEELRTLRRMRGEADRAFNNRERGLAQWAISCEDDVRDLLYVMLRPLMFTGEEKSGLDAFLEGDLDVLIASSAISTGVDRLQPVCNRLVINVLPWTAAEFEQLIGRIHRQGQTRNVEVIIPITRADVSIGSYSPWPRAPSILRSRISRDLTSG
jgi:helicase-like protein